MLLLAIVPVLPVVFCLTVQVGECGRLEGNWFSDLAPIGPLVGEQVFYLGLDA